MEGQKDAFAELVRRYTRMVMWYVSDRVKDQTEIEEIAQEATVRAYVGLPNLRAPGAFSRWLIAIADSVIRTKRRAESKIIVLESPAEHLETPPEAGPLSKLSRQELREELRVEMRLLPPHYRTVLGLKYMHDLTAEQISQRLMVPIGTVRSRLSRSYAILHKRLGGKRRAPQSGPSDTSGQSRDMEVQS